MLPERCDFSNQRQFSLTSVPQISSLLLLAHFHVSVLQLAALYVLSTRRDKVIHQSEYTEPKLPILCAIVSRGVIVVKLPSNDHLT